MVPHENYVIYDLYPHPHGYGLIGGQKYYLHWFLAEISFKMTARWEKRRLIMLRRSGDIFPTDGQPDRQNDHNKRLPPLNHVKIRNFHFISAIMNLASPLSPWLYPLHSNKLLTLCTKSKRMVIRFWERNSRKKTGILKSRGWEASSFFL